MASVPIRAGLGWVAIVRLGVVQASIGAIVMLATSLLNRVMVVEYGMLAALPAGLVAWHYVVQLSRPIWGHGSDKGQLRTPWIMGGMSVLALGALAAVNATVMMDNYRGIAIAISIFAFTLIGAGVGAAGTSLLALLASAVSPDRRAPAAALTWIMMVAGIVISAATAGALLEPYSERRLAFVCSGVAAVALLIAWLAIQGVEDPDSAARLANEDREAADFRTALQDILQERQARWFTVFIFVSMLAYSMQDLILEPFAGLVFGMTPGESTQLAGLQHGGVLAGMIVTGLGGSAFAGRTPLELKHWIVVGCVGSAVSLAGLATAAVSGAAWPLEANVFALGFCNGAFAVAAIGAMMGLAGSGKKSGEGIRMGVWGASQAIAFALGGLIGAVGVDLIRRTEMGDARAFQLVFVAEALLFLVAAILAVKAAARSDEKREERWRSYEL